MKRWEIKGPGNPVWLGPPNRDRILQIQNEYIWDEMGEIGNGRKGQIYHVVNNQLLHVVGPGKEVPIHN